MTTPQVEHWDVVVVGAGPAGAAAALGALTADPALRVLLLDRSDFPRDKSCGDGIAPHVLDALAEVGSGDVIDDWAPLRDLEMSHGHVSVSGAMRREVHVVPREVFDARLVERAVAAGAVLRRHRATSVSTPGVPVVSGEIGAEVVVGADGAHSMVREALLGRRRDPRAIAIRGYAPTTPEMRGRQLIRYGHRRQPSYAWAFDRGDGLANVGYGELLPDDRSGAAPPSRALLLEQLEELVPGAAATGSGWRGHHLPLSSWRWDQPDGRVLLVGDAAGLVNPMTGEGIYYAVATGIAAGRTAAGAIRSGRADDAGARHRRVVRSLLGRHLRHTFVASRLARAPRLVDAGIEAAGRDRHVFDTLVELGLGGGRIDARLATGLLRSLARPSRPSPELDTDPQEVRGG
ncbi:NAD(P)/FAD-dependent oxidoreductase [Nocardioides sp. zg-1308]|uniref:NAD(P)/FAD-dependent oxidoreductase n=1 Tax=Nocardioides sp. zg-1308 TaxID=2736253 RepID=UPI001555F422|nr:NAD(P)/FAD-dependent oxidoreductase [Nocardioides sp. zg-1308]NPD06872.1 NAD(P)/FAD-dependent oxidoreductase [Nocardioides sp. zg-1308]